MPDRVAVVTGAAGGIGLALARQLASSGHRVLMVDVQDCPDVPGSVKFVADVGNPDETRRIASAAFDLGPVALVCSNAGIVRSGKVWEQSAESWRQVIDVNLMASVHIAREFVPRLLAAGSPAHLLITGSMASVTVRPGNGPYGVAKHGLLALAETLSLELAESPIGVTLLMPGLVATPMTAGAPGGASADEVATIALDAVTAGRLFAFTEPDRLDGVRERFAAILG